MQSQTTLKESKEIKINTQISSTRIIVGSTNTIKAEAVLAAFEKRYGYVSTIVEPRSVNSKVSSQPIGLDETKLGAINRMNACAEDLTEITQQEFALAVGLENGIVAGENLPGNYSKDHWYDIGFVAVRYFKGGTHFDYVTSTTPLQIPNDEKCGMLSPLHPASLAEKLAKYRAYIMPLIEANVDIYQLFSRGKCTRESALSDACFKAFQHLGNIKFLKSVTSKFDVVLLFGTFDLFHELHKKLIDDAARIGKEVIVYVNDDVNKFRRDPITHKAIKESKNEIIDNPIKRKENVAQYLSLRGEVKLKQGKMTEQLAATIKQCQLTKKTVAIFGGNDQFESYPQLLELCHQTKTPLITKLRGETDNLLCTTDLKTKMKFTKIAQYYTLDLDHLSSVFFKKRLDSKEAATDYLLKLMSSPKESKITDDQVLGLNEAEVWQYNLSDKSVKRLINAYDKADKILLCLPGRSSCNIGRARKILFTIHEQFVPVNLRKSLTCFVACYKQGEKTTEDALKELNANPLVFFSDDAMIYMRLLILPKINDKVIVQKLGINYQIKKEVDITRKSIAEIKKALSGITIWARSYGTVIAIELENAFRFTLCALGYQEQEIIEAGKEICVISMSNLAPLERPRLFTTLSVTGFNDTQAKKYIVDFPRMVEKYYRPKIALSQNFIGSTHNATMVDVPEKFTELATGRIIKDPKRHYTPNYDSIRKQIPGQPFIDNAGPILIHKELELMLQRDGTFDLHQTERLNFSLS